MKKSTTLDELNNSLNILAGIRLKDKKIELTEKHLEKECARLERCIEFHYKIDKVEKLQYIDFASKFILENFDSIIYSDKFSGLYLDDIKQVDWIEEYEL